jgi:hypothetical protein
VRHGALDGAAVGAQAGAAVEAGAVAVHKCCYCPSSLATLLFKSARLVRGARARLQTLGAWCGQPELYARSSAPLGPFTASGPTPRHAQLAWQKGHLRRREKGKVSLFADALRDGTRVPGAPGGGAAPAGQRGARRVSRRRRARDAPASPAPGAARAAARRAAGARSRGGR